MIFTTRSSPGKVRLRRRLCGLLAITVAVTTFPSKATVLVSAQSTATRDPTGFFSFDDSSLGSTLRACEEVDIVLRDVSETARGIAPYYMISIPVGGTPQTTLLQQGDPVDDGATVKWTVRHQIGTTLLLNVVDSTGTGGGIPSRTFTVTSGSSSSCVVPEPTSQPDFLTWTNATANVATCDPLGIAWDAAVGPFSVMITSLDSNYVTNVTGINASRDAYIYVNRAPGGSRFAVSVADGDGNWAYNANKELVSTVDAAGGADTNCGGRENSLEHWGALGFIKPDITKSSSSTGGSTSNGNSNNGGSDSTGDGQDSPKDGGSGSSKEEETTKKSDAGMIAGIVVGVVVALLAVGVGVWFLRRKKSAEEPDEKAAAASISNGGSGGNSPVGLENTITPFNVGAQSPRSAAASASMERAPSRAGSTTTKNRSDVGTSVYPRSTPTTTTSGLGSSMYTSGVDVNSPSSDSGTEATSMFNRRAETTFGSSDASSASIGFAHPLPLAKAIEAEMNATQNAAVTVVGSATGILIQHQDGGTPQQVTELPPPYMARGNNR